MDWSGDLKTFLRAAVETQDVDAFTRSLRSVPRGGWPAVELRLRVTLGGVRLIPDSGNAEGREVANTIGVSEDLIRRAEVLDAKKRALRDEDAARRGGAARPA